MLWTWLTRSAERPLSPPAGAAGVLPSESWIYSSWPSTATRLSAKCSAGLRSVRSRPGTAPRARPCAAGGGGSSRRACPVCWIAPMRPRNSPTRLSAEVEAEICELRRRHPRWGARRISHELSGRGLESAPSRATVHRVLSRNGLVRAQEQQHPRKYRPWQREVPMHLWQMDLAGRRQLSGSSAAAGDTAEDSSDVPRSARRSAATTVSVEHADNQSASRTRWPRHLASPAVLENLRKAGAAKAEGAPPLSQAQVDQIVAILRQAGSQASARRGRGAPHRTAGGRGSGTRHRRHGGTVTLLSRSRSPSAAARARWSGPP